MAYIVIKTINGRQYRYQQRTYREGGKVRTESIYLGPVDGGTRRKPIAERVSGFIDANFRRAHGLPDEDAMLDQYNAIVERERAVMAAALGDLHTQYGLRMPTYDASGAVIPQEKAPSEEGAADVSTPTPASA
jgi:hypothetical protein